MRLRLSSLFGAELSASVLIAAVVGVCCTFHAALPRRNFLEVSTLFMPVGLILGPVLAARSPRRFVLGTLAAVAVFAICLLAALPINGREALPLSVWAVMPVGVPAYDHCPLHWQARALWNASLFLFCCDLGLLLLRRVGETGAPWKKRALALLAAAAAATLVSLVLYRLSWSARVSGTFAHPLYTQREMIGSLLLFFAVFPATPYIAIRIHDRLLNVFDRGRPNPRATREETNTPAA